MKHKYAELMLQYAQDAMETNTPWKLWEQRGSTSWEWQEVPSYGPSWYEEAEYRRKAKIIRINGFDVPEPVRHCLKDGDDYFIPIFDRSILSMQFSWADDAQDRLNLDNGVVHLTRKAAVLHAKALLSFTKSRVDS